MTVNHVIETGDSLIMSTANGSQSCFATLRDGNYGGAPYDFWAVDLNWMGVLGYEEFLNALTNRRIHKSKILLIETIANKKEMY